MPEPRPQPKLTPHPIQGARHGASRASRAPNGNGGGDGGVAYAELHTTSNFTFLTGASHPEELVETAARLGHRAVALTDVNTLAGIVRAFVAARDLGFPLIVGSRLVFRRAEREGPRSVLVYPTDRASYGRLCRLLTVGKRRAPKGECHLVVRDLFEHAEGLLAVAVPPAPAGESTLEDDGFEAFVRDLADVFDDDRLSVAGAALFGGDDRGWLASLAALAGRVGVPLVATNDVHYHVRERAALQDVLACIREGCTLDEAGFRLFPNRERVLKSGLEMALLFADHPAALARSVEIAERASAFGLDELRYQYPDEVSPDASSPMEHLVELTWEGAAERYPPERYPGGVPEKVRGLVRHEFGLIEELGYAPYFLTVHDIVRFARARGILCQGRGAAANSAVCYCLGVTAVDPDRIDILFERFVSKERDEPPDIDVDFEHERREEVIQYLYAKYGRDRAALTAEVISYRGRSAVRDVGKALGLSLDCIDRLAKELDWWNLDFDMGRLRALGLDPNAPTMRQLLALVPQLLGFPRHLSQHVGGFVITRGLLSELVPIENAAMADRTVIEWDKDDIDAMGMLKVDVLGLGMLTAVRKSFELINARGDHGDGPIELATVPPEDPRVYDMICEADTVGVFQIESRAQMSMLPRLKPREFYDLVIEVAIVRPGPIQGDMVHPYLRRRNGEEEVSYPNEEVKRVLEKTLGVPLFQEQAMALSVVAAGFTAGEADELRRVMAAWKRKGDRLRAMCDKLMRGLVRNGYTQEFAERFYKQIMGFGEYGFPESHAASFALIVYVSCWLKRYHPAAFTAALVNSQPMGFYAPAQLVRDAREHGVEVRPIDVNASEWDCTLEDDARGDPAIRLGMCLVKGLGQDDADAIARTVRRLGAFESVHALHEVSGVRASALRRLAYADAFTSLGLDRQQALWEVRALRDRAESDLWTPKGAREEAPSPEEERELPPRLPPVSMYKRVLHDYASTRLSLKAHPISFLRDDLDRRGVARAGELTDEARFPNGRRASAAGLVLVRQRPGTAGGIIFLTIEDETGVANLIVWPKVFERFRSVARHATTVLVHGRIERAQGVVHLVARHFESLDSKLDHLLSRSRDFH